MHKRLNKLLSTLVAKKVDSPTTIRELSWLWYRAVNISHAWNDAKIVEFGTLAGKSAIMLADGVKFSQEKNKLRQHSSHVWTVDNYEEYKRYENQDIHTLVSFEDMQRRIVELGYAAVLTAVEEDVFEFLGEQSERSIAMLWVDAGHSYKHVSKTLDLALPKMRKDALMCGHDYCWNQRGVIYAVEEWREEYVDNLTGFGIVDSLWWAVVRYATETGK